MQEELKTQEGAVEHNRGLLLIGLFKLSKSILSFAIGVGAIHFLHKDLGDALLKLAHELRFDSEHRFVDLLMSKADNITPARLKAIGFATFLYSGVALAEGVGLMMEKVWAEYLTLILTVGFLPWEIFELFRHQNIYRVLIMAINLTVLVYLIWLVRRQRAKRRERGA